MELELCSFLLNNKIASYLLDVAISISSKTLCRVCRHCFTFNCVYFILLWICPEYVLQNYVLDDAWWHLR